MQPLSFGARLWLAILLPFRVLFDGDLAARISGLDAPVELPPPRPEPEPEPKPEPALKEVEPEPVAPEPDTTAALQLLAILQREGRFIDFLQEDVGSFADAEVGAAARVVHEGCARGLKDVLTLEVVRDEAEGARVELAPGYDAARTRVTGNVVGEPPLSGTLAHHGWQVSRIQLPELIAGHDPSIVAPAEVEV